MTKLEASLAEAPEICVARHTVRLANREIRLPDLSFRLLRLLSERAPDPVPFDEIERVVWSAHVSRETVKQRVKLLRDSLIGLGVASGGVESARSIGYRLAEPFALYEPQVIAKRPSGARWIWGAAIGLAACLSALLAYPFILGERAPAGQISLAIHSDPPAVTGEFPPSAWHAAHQGLMVELSRMSNLVVVADEGDKQSAYLVVAMKSIPDGPYETLSLALIETGTGAVLWAETFGLDQDGYGKPVAIFVADAHRQIAAFGLQPGPNESDENASRARQLYLSASSLAKSGAEGDLLSAKASLDTALALRPSFALARSLRARIAARLVTEHGGDDRLATTALEEAHTLVDAHPDVPEFRRSLATVQMARGFMSEALANLELAQNHMPFLKSDVAALKRRISRPS